MREGAEQHLAWLEEPAAAERRSIERPAELAVEAEAPWVPEAAGVPGAAAAPPWAGAAHAWAAAVRAAPRVAQTRGSAPSKLQLAPRWQ